MADNQLVADTEWYRPQDTPRYTWVGCRYKHLGQVYTHQLDDLTPCPECYEPRKVLSERQVAIYKRHNRLCRHCKVGNHQLCTGVACFGCDHGREAYLVAL